jgi:hypothetical protein
MMNTVNYILQKFWEVIPSQQKIDQIIICLKYLWFCRRLPNIDNPKRYTEKIQRRKLYDRNPLLTILQDKYRVREYVAERIGEKYLIPCYHATNDINSINFEKLPPRFVLKANHGCGWNLFVEDKSSLNEKKVRKILQQWLNSNYYYKTREWAYKNILPIIMVEKFLKDTQGFPFPADYKISSFNGKPFSFFMFLGRNTPYYQIGRYSIEGMRLTPYPYNPILGGKKVPLLKITPPITQTVLEEMLDISEKLSRGIDHLRVDLYLSGEKIYFGEMTIYHTSGFIRFDRDEYDLSIGANWKQPY